MAISYSNLFTNRLKPVIGAVEDHESFYTTITTYLGDINTGFATASSQDLLGQAHSSVDTARSNNLSSIQQLILLTNSIIQDRTNVLNELPEVTSTSTSEILRALYDDMDGSQSVAQSTVTIGSSTDTTANTNAGDVYTSKVLDGLTQPAYYASAHRSYAGVTSEISLTSDTINVACISDRDTNGVTMGSEQFTISGKPQAGSLFSHLTNGSGGNQIITCAQGDSVISSNTLGFESFTSGTPDGWTVVTGTPSTDFTSETTEVVDSGTSLEIVGACELKVPIRTAVSPLGHYLAGFLVKSDGALTGATLNVFFEGTGFTTESVDEILMDNTALNAQTAFGIESFSSVLPADLPSDLHLHIEVTGISAGTIYLDFGFCQQLTYHNGIAIGVISGREEFLIGDNFEFTVTNNDSSNYQKFFRDAFGFQLPSSGSPTLTY